MKKKSPTNKHLSSHKGSEKGSSNQESWKEMGRKTLADFASSNFRQDTANKYKQLDKFKSGASW